MKKILIIEDNKNNRYLIRFLLEKSGFQVIEAHTGMEGVERAGTDEPDLIVMDIQLPDIDGLEATRRIRRTGGNVPIVALTSYALSGDREKALHAGCDGYIEKPILPEGFLTEIRKYLG